MYDLIIIGGGPAGLTAALYAGRSRLKTLLLEKAGLGGQIILSPTIENYPGFAGGVGTAELIQAMHKQVEELEVEIRYEEVNKIAGANGLFQVSSSEAEYQTKTIIVASGACPKKLDIPGEARLIARGVSYCGTCDGPLFKNKEIFVVGGGDKAVEEAIYLSRFASKVSLIHRRQELRASKILQERLFENSSGNGCGYRKPHHSPVAYRKPDYGLAANKKIEVLWDTVPLEILGDKVVEGIRIKNLKSSEIKELKAGGVFVFVGIHPHTQFLGDMIKLDEIGFILTDEDMRTSREGVWACGDCRKKTLTQVITACSDGAIAAFNANRYLEVKK